MFLSHLLVSSQLVVLVFEYCVCHLSVFYFKTNFDGDQYDIMY
jgi:hypothetical protein